MRKIHAILGIVLVCVLSYSNSLEVPFQFDDQRDIVRNELVHDLSRLAELSQYDLMRTVGNVTFALNYALGGTETTGYHAINIAIHFGNCLLLFVLLAHLIRIEHSCSERQAITVGFACAVLFACHPLNSQAVTYIVQRQASLVTMFYLLTVYLYLKHCQNRHDRLSRLFFGGAIVSGTLALFTKENSATLGALLLLIEVVFFNLRMHSIRTKKAEIALIVYFLVLPIFALTVSPNQQVIDIGSDPTHPTTFQYILMQPQVILRYLGLVVLPMGQTIDHYVRLSDTFFAAPVFLAFLFHALVIVLACVFLHQKRLLMATGILAFYLLLLPESSIIPLEPMYEHRMYLPFLGIMIFISPLILQVLEKINTTRQYLASIGFLAIVATLTNLTLDRNRVWSSPYTLWSEAAMLAPFKLRPQLNLAVLHFHAGSTKEALAHWQMAAYINPRWTAVHENMGIASIKIGLHEKALFHFRQALEINPKPRYFRNLAKALTDIDQPEAALPVAERCLELYPQNSVCATRRDRILEKLRLVDQEN